MSVATGKDFQSGNSQALHLPKAFRLRSGAVKLVTTADGFTVHDECAPARRVKAFAALGGRCLNFPVIEANAPLGLRRDWEGRSLGSACYFLRGRILGESRTEP